MQELQSETGRDAEPPEAGDELVPVEDAELFDRVMKFPKKPVIPDMDALNGMLTAFVCSPKLIEPDIIMMAITNIHTDDPVRFEDNEEAGKFFEILQRQLIDLHYVLSDSNRRYKPYIKCKERPGLHWVTGFAMGTVADVGTWEELIMGKEHEDTMGMILACSREEREVVIEDIPDVVQSIYDHFAEERDLRGDSYPKFFAKHTGHIKTMDDETHEKLKRSMARRKGDGS